VQNLQLTSGTPVNPLIPELAKTIEAGARWKSKQVHAGRMVGAPRTVYVQGWLAF